MEVENVRGIRGRVKVGISLKFVVFISVRDDGEEGIVKRCL